MTTKVGPAKPPKGPRRGSLTSIHYNDEAVEVEGVGSTPMELDEETKWIRSHIKRRECKLFTINAKAGARVPSPDQDPECQCGHSFSEHSHEARNAVYTGERWSKKTHTVQEKTNAFGEVEFAGYGGNIGRYIRVDVETKMSDMLELMMNIWGMDKPNLLISVTGGAKNFQMNKRLKETFRRGLMKAAQTTGAWIITGGTHAGVMKHVGESVKDFGLTTSSQNPVVVIGIAPWGCIQNRELLINEECLGLWPANYRIEKEQKSKESFLDPNHTHFILCDNGTEHRFAVEIPFRAKLENELAKIKTDTGDNAVSVPIVLLVLEGGPGTLETVHQAIQNNTPAVIVKGSGRAADILAHAYIYAKEEEIEAQDSEGRKQKKTVRQMDESLEIEVIEMVEKEFGSNEVHVHVGRIKDCLNKSDLMSIYEHDSRTGGSKDIDVAMLKALLKANKNQVMDQLRLALAWNRIDVAKSEIFTDDKRWPTGSLDDVMVSAIQLNRVDFVELFLDHGVSLREFLTCKRLLFLYNRIPQNALLRTLLNKIKMRENPTRKNFSLLDVGMLMQELIGDYYRPSYKIKKAYAELDPDDILDGQMDPKKGVNAIQGFTKVAVNIGANVEHEKLMKKHSILPQTHDFENPAQELFIWSVLTIRQDMAKLFWAEGKDAIAAALVGNSLLKAMEGQTEDTELVHTIREFSGEWSTLSIGVLSECYATDDQKAQDLLVRELVHWGDATCILIAVKADNKDFISQTACQSLLNSIWMGKMMQENKTWKLLTCICCPPLALWLIKFQFDEVYMPVDTRQKIELREEVHDGKAPLKRQGTFIHSRGEDNIRKRPNLKHQNVSNISTDHIGHSKLSIQEDHENKEDDVPVVIKHVHSIRERMYYFFTAPVVIFLNNVLSYIAFLFLFSYILIVDLHPTVSAAEILLMIWVFTIFTEEIRQVVSTSSNSLSTKLLSYISDTWNVVDIITIVLFIIGMVLRFIPMAETFEAGRVFLAINFVSFFLRLLHIFSVHKELGPKLVMIGRMIQDLLYFVVILMVFVISYAIASHSILFPNSPLNGDTVIAVLRRSYWNIYGELFLDEIAGEPTCTYDDVLWRNNTYPRCPSDVGRYVVPIMMGIYMLLANVLLLNLLIAMFSYTFQKVQDNTDKHWFYQRYSLIYEYYTRPVLCPPFICFSHLYLFIKFILSCCCRTCGAKNDQDDDFRRKFPNERELVQWENLIADAFHHKTEMKAFDKMEYKVDTTSIRLDLLINRMDEVQEQQQMMSAPGPAPQADPQVQTPVPPSSVVVKMPPQLESRLNNLEKQMEKTVESLNWIVKALVQQQMGADKAPPVFKTKEQRQKEVESAFAKEELARKRAEEQSEIIIDMIEKREEVHYRSRSSPYPGTQVMRFSVPDDKVSWQVSFPEYNPICFTTMEVLQRPYYADADLLNMSLQGRSLENISFNTFDKVSNVDRSSFLGNYEVKDGLPVNPRGRTGLYGRGLLGRWGPNKAVDPIVTRTYLVRAGILPGIALLRQFRWKMVNGERKMKHGKPVLQFAAVMRSDNQMWSLPGAFLPPGASISDHFKAEFTREALGDLEGEKNVKKVEKKLAKLWKTSIKVYEGYADDPRNTDNAWVETIVCNYHDSDGTILKHVDLRAGESVELATWMTASSKLTLHGSHAYFLSLTAEKLGAYF